MLALALLLAGALGVLGRAPDEKSEEKQYLYVSVALPAQGRLQYRDENGCWQTGAAPGWQAVAEGVYAWEEALGEKETPRALFDRVWLPAWCRGGVQVWVSRFAAESSTPRETWEKQAQKVMTSPTESGRTASPSSSARIS